MDHKEGQRPRSTNDADATSRPSESAGDVAALVQPWLRLSLQLTPLIGESGFCALFGRALRVSSERYERFGTGDHGRALADLVTYLTKILNEMGPGQAPAANSALLENFTRLLGNLIGEALTKQLLHVASAGADGQTHGQEQK